MTSQSNFFYQLIDRMEKSPVSPQFQQFYYGVMPGIVVNLPELLITRHNNYRNLALFIAILILELSAPTQAFWLKFAALTLVLNAIAITAISKIFVNRIFVFSYDAAKAVLFDAMQNRQMNEETFEFVKEYGSKLHKFVRLREKCEYFSLLSLLGSLFSFAFFSLI